MLDEIDRTILRELQRDGRQSNRDLAARVGLSPNATGVRLKRLFESGVITGIYAQLDQPAMGRPIETIVEMRVRDGADGEALRQFFRDDRRVVEAWLITGRTDYILRVAAESTTDLHDLIQELGHGRGFADEIITSLILERIWAQ